MRKLVLATIVTVATVAPALAQTNADNLARQSASWARFERTVAAPRQNTMKLRRPLYRRLEAGISRQRAELLIRLPDAKIDAAFRVRLGHTPSMLRELSRTQQGGDLWRHAK
jgi:hypothetical protein